MRNLAVYRPKWDIGLLILVGGSALLAQGDWESFHAVCDWARENSDWETPTTSWLSVVGSIYPPPWRTQTVVTWSIHSRPIAVERAL